MGRVPPAEKLPLAVRKNVRDEWEQKKEELEKTLSEVLNTVWTISVEPLQIYAYANDGWAKTSTGSVIYNYMNDAIGRIKYFLDHHGEGGKKEINDICHAHVLTLDEDETERFNYCGCDVQDGQLRVLFRQGNMGTNIYDALATDTLLKALNEAPPAGDAADSDVSFAVRTGIRQDYEAEAEKVRKRIADMLERPSFRFEPNWAATYQTLREAAAQKNSGVRDDWEGRMGSIALAYFQGLAGQLEYQKFGEDDMLREGFNEGVEKGVAELRVVEKLTSETYNECDVEDGVLYLKTTPKNFGTNVDYVAQKLMDKL